MTQTLEAVQVEGPRACRPEEVADMIAMTNGVMRAGSDQSFLTDYPLVYRPDNLKNIQIVKVGDDIASVVPFITKNIEFEGCHLKIGIISPTATSPYHRRKGYALQCLNAGLDKMTETGIDLAILWTLVPTFEFYERADFQAVRSQGWRIDCDASDTELFHNNGQGIVTLDIANPAHLGDVQRLYENEKHGIVRTKDDYATLFNLPKMRTLLAVEADGQTSAYLLLSEAGNKPGILEACGSKNALETLLLHALGRLASRSIPIYVNLTASPLSELLRNKMPARFAPQSAGPMMIRINNLFEFVERLRDWFIERNAGNDRRFSLEVTDTGEVIGFDFSHDSLKLTRNSYALHLPLSRAELVSVIFGPHPERPAIIPEELDALFPFYFPIPMLDHS